MSTPIYDGPQATVTEKVAISGPQPDWGVKGVHVHVTGRGRTTEVAIGTVGDEFYTTGARTKDLANRKLGKARGEVEAWLQTREGLSAVARRARAAVDAIDTDPRYVKGRRAEVEAVADLAERRLRELDDDDELD